MHVTSLSRKIFICFNYAFLLILSLLCLFPIVHILAISLSSSTAAQAGLVTLWPVDFTWKAYDFVLEKPSFMRSMGVAAQRVLLGTTIYMLFTVCCAYPLSKEQHQFKARTVYVWIFVFTILFGGGLIPWYMTIKYTGLLDSIWALVIPGAVPIFNIILLLNFFRGLPRELEDAAFIDGASHWMTMWRVYIPLSLPALATLILFTVVHHWNSWFDGIILMNNPARYPLSSYLQTLLISEQLVDITPQDIEVLKVVSNRTAKAAQIFLGTLPILLVYPFLQKYFMKGIVLGSVKG